MVIKKFIAATEAEALEMAKADLGEDVVVTEVKKNDPKGVMRFFKRPSIEITAAVDEDKKDEQAPDFSLIQKAIEEKQFKPAPDSKAAKKEAEMEKLVKNRQIIPDDEEDEKEDSSKQSEKQPSIDLEERLSSLQDLLEKQMAAKNEEEKKQKDEAIDKQKAYLDLIRNQLIENEVEASYADQILEEIEGTLSQNVSLDHILSSVYQKIVLKIGQPHLIDLRSKRTKYLFFIGPTGVGKTTTIAKIASTMKLSKKTKVALITSDTYRIAAVEQLKTYANILGTPLQVIYTPEEMDGTIEELSDYDVVLVDTAGRSHTNAKQKADIQGLLDTVNDRDKEVFLVLSATTKYRDLVKITSAYSEITKYNLIFTKLDETDTIGSIFNIRILTGAPLSYATWGQNVPDDIGKVDAQRIAKQLLGGNVDGSGTTA